MTVEEARKILDQTRIDNSKLSDKDAILIAKQVVEMKSANNKGE